MIAGLAGIIDEIGSDYAVINVHGVCYHVSASAKTLSRLGSPGATVKILTVMRVREDDMQLFAFADAPEKHAFTILTNVPGVGAKVALALLSVLAPPELALAISAGDKAALTRADGVGPKLAARLLTELKGKLGLETGLGASSPLKNQNGMAGALIPDGVGSDAISALSNLGYGRSDAASVVARIIANDADINLGECIRRALKELAA